MTVPATSRIYPRVRARASSALGLRVATLVALVVCALSADSDALPNVTAPKLVLSGDDFSVTLALPAFVNGSAISASVKVSVLQGQAVLAQYDSVATRDAGGAFVGTITLDNVKLHSCSARSELRVAIDDPTLGQLPAAIAHCACFSGPVTLLPPILTLVVSLTAKQVTLALLLGVFLCALLANSLQGGAALLRTFDYYVVGALGNRSNAAVVVFTFILAGIIGMVRRSGGAKGLAESVSRIATNPFRGQLATLLLSFSLFFDDYSSILITGATFRPLQAALRISKEKLAVIVHSLAVSLASLAPISSWVGVEIGYVQPVTQYLGVQSPFLALIQSIVLRFFPLTLIAMVVGSVVMRREFGRKLLHSERRERAGEAGNELLQDVVDDNTADQSSTKTSDEAPDEGALAPKEGVPHRWYNGAVPFLVEIFGAAIGMYLSGLSKIDSMPADSRPTASVINAFSHCDSVDALVWASSAAWVVGLVMLKAQKILGVGESMSAFMAGAADVIEPTIILILAWALGSAIADIRVSQYIGLSLASGGLPGWVLPPAAAAITIAVSTSLGSAYGTMGILVPLLTPVAFHVGGPHLAMHTLGAVLGSSIFGNTWTPIGDTTVLTCLAVGCDLQSHVATVYPIAFTSAAVSLVLGHLLVAAAGVPAWAGLLLCIAAVLGILRLFGGAVEDDAEERRDYAINQPDEADPLLLADD